jgi:hypothetical protein
MQMFVGMSAAQFLFSPITAHTYITRRKLKRGWQPKEDGICFNETNEKQDGHLNIETIWKESFKYLNM